MQRARVYAAEACWEARLDAARRGARRAEVAGSALLLPEERQFGTLAAAQAYADALVARRGLAPVRLRTRRGQGSAHWEPAAGGASAVIALPVPERGTSWAMREAVLLHELAHHAHAASADDADADADHDDRQPARHGPAFAAVLLDLVAEALGDQAAFALRVDLGEHGVVVAR